MLTVFFLWLLVFFYAKKLRVLYCPCFMFNLLTCTAITIFAFVEIEILQPDNFFINPDENWFFEESCKSFQEIWADHSRYLIHILVNRVTRLTSGEWGLRLQYTPFSVLISLLLYDSLKKKASLWLFPVIGGYFFFLSTMNLRDSVIIAAVLFFVLKISRSNWCGILSWGSLATISFLVIRPEFSIFWVIITFWLLITFRYRSYFGLVYLLPCTLIVGIFIFADSYINKISDFFYPGRMEVYFQDRSIELEKISFLNRNASAIIRQIVTPLPTSKIYYLLTHGPSDNLVLKELFRIVLMVALYSMIVVLTVKWKQTYWVLKKHKFSHVLLLFIVLNVIAYSIYGDGGGSTRNKVYPFLGVFILFLKMHSWKSIKI